jgi:hypothetical protein
VVCDIAQRRIAVANDEAAPVAAVQAVGRQGPHGHAMTAGAGGQGLVVHRSRQAQAQMNALLSA